MIKELTFEEAARLRELVKTRFLRGPFNGAGFKISQHKDSYKHLADDIARFVEGAKASVTTHRLRKFFYYVDPEVCSPEKLEKPSFGDDFIQALLKYVGEEPKPVVSLPKPQNLYWNWLRHGAALLLLLAVAVVSWLWFDQPEYWPEEFNDVTVEGLKSRDWQILDYDPVAFSRQVKSGYLTLYTYPGDYWVKEGEAPAIKNLLIKRLGYDRCVITTRMPNFDPNQNWQQAGIILLGPDLDRKNFLNVSFAFNAHNEKDGSPDQKIQITLCQNGRVGENYEHLRVPEFDPAFPEVGILIKVAKRKIIVTYWAGYAWSPVREGSKFELEISFTPTYVGLAAFQGFTDNDSRPLGADTIPAFFDYLKVEPLSN